MMPYESNLKLVKWFTLFFFRFNLLGIKTAYPKMPLFQIYAFYRLFLLMVKKWLKLLISLCDGLFYAFVSQRKHVLLSYGFFWFALKVF